MSRRRRAARPDSEVGDGPAHDRAREPGPEAVLRAPRSGTAPGAAAGGGAAECGDGEASAARRPSSESSAGWSVSAAATDANGIRKPPRPIERMNGIGMRSSSPSPIATARPEKTTARPAVARCGDRDRLRSRPRAAPPGSRRRRAASSRPRARARAARRGSGRRSTTGITIGERVDDRERGGDRAGGEQERDRRPRATARGRQRAGRGAPRQRERLASAQVGGEDRIEVVLDRGLAGDEGRRPGVAPRSARRRSSVYALACWRSSVVAMSA